MDQCQVCVSGICGPSPCPYCRSVAGMVHILPTYWPDGMGCHVCERLLDRGWFRAGRQCYLPLHDRVCCVPYQFRVDALAFQPSKAQMKVLRNMTRFLNGEKSLAKNGKLQGQPRQPKPSPLGDGHSVQLQHALACLVQDALAQLQAQGKVPAVPAHELRVAVPQHKAQLQRGVAFYCSVGFVLARRAVLPPPAPPGTAGEYAALLVQALRSLRPRWPAEIAEVSEASGFVNFTSVPRQPDRLGDGHPSASPALPSSSLASSSSPATPPPLN
eukprot:EG_transcript_22975